MAATVVVVAVLALAARRKARKPGSGGAPASTIVLLAALLLASCDHGTAAAPPTRSLRAALHVEPQDVAKGVFGVPAVVEQHVRVLNTGTSPVVIRGLDYDCATTTEPDVVGAVVAPGDELVFRILFDLTQEGEWTRIVTLRSGNPGGTYGWVHTVRISAVGRCKVAPERPRIHANNTGGARQYVYIYGTPLSDGQPAHVEVVERSNVVVNSLSVEAIPHASRGVIARAALDLKLIDNRQGGRVALAASDKHGRSNSVPIEVLPFAVDGHVSERRSPIPVVTTPSVQRDGLRR